MYQYKLTNFDINEYRTVFSLDPRTRDDDVIDHFYKFKYNVFVYCSAKCGSTNLHLSFSAKGIKNMHIHGALTFAQNYKVNFSVFDLINYYTEKFPNEKFYFIDSYRTPIERKISSFFQENEALIKEKEVHELIEYFNKNIYKIENYHSIDQIMKESGVPMFKEFDFERGYVVQEKDNKVFIKLLFKNIDDWSYTLSQVMGTKIDMIPANKTERKSVSNKYKEFKTLYKVPTFYLENVLPHDTHFQIYNSPQDKLDYVSQWMQKSYIQENTPDIFDPEEYISLNKDLKKLSLFEAANHYMIHGINEKRKYKKDEST